MKILGISCYYHDAAAALIVDDEIVSAAHEERFTRVKHTDEFPSNAIRFCLEESGLRIDDLDAVVFYDKPIVKFERILTSFYAIAPKGLFFFLKSIPIWLSSKLFLRKTIIKALQEIQPLDKKNLNLLFSDHHLSHAASAFFVSNHEESALLTIDAVGEWSTASIGAGNGNEIQFSRTLSFPNSVGLLYSAFTYYLGFKVNSGEYKLMGLAPYGNPSAEQTKLFIHKIKNDIVKINEDGSIHLNQRYFAYLFGNKMVKEKAFFQLFGFKRRKEEEPMEPHHLNLAFAIQSVLEEVVIKMAKTAKQLTNAKVLCLSGGVALNCVANGKLASLGLFEKIYIQPASGDAGGALGAALAVNYMYFKRERKYNEELDHLKGAYLGPYYSSKEVRNMNQKWKAKGVFLEEDVLIEKVANLLADGKVVGWFQGRSEFGPRALGNRSILANPLEDGMQKKLNLKIKKREGFRPFAPVVLREDYSKYFDSAHENPYMLFVSPIHPEWRENMEGFKEGNYMDQLYKKRSILQAVTHVDYTARVQSLERQTNPKLWNLLTAFKKITGEGVLINTSFNVRGEPIVETPENAFKCFMNTEMDFLIINNCFYDKEDQLPVDFKQEFTLD